MKIAAIIPARYASTRFPGKPLVPLLGKSLVIWVAEAAAGAVGKENVYVATEDKRIQSEVERNGFQSLMTSSAALTGTDRVWEAAQQVSADTYINIQGDEPLIDPGDIQKILQEKRRFPDEVINGICPIAQEDDPVNINIPKVVIAENGRMVYISRVPLPGFKSEDFRPAFYWKQVCIYAYSFKELEAFGKFGRKGYLEQCEDIEILRFIELGIPVRMVETGGGAYAVDVPEDVIVCEKALMDKRNR